MIVDMIGMPADDTRTPIQVIENLGISFTRCEPQPIADQWMFYGCDNVPEDLPDFVRLGVR